LLVILAAIVLLFMLLPKIWAKRTNLFLSALTVAYAFKSYVLFTSCYNNYCPEKKYGVFLMLISSVVMLVASAFPYMKLKPSKKGTRLRYLVKKNQIDPQHLKKCQS